MTAVGKEERDHLWVYAILPIVLIGFVGMLVYGGYYTLQAVRPEAVAGISQGQVDIWLSTYTALVRWILALTLIPTLRRTGQSAVGLIAPGGDPWRFRLLPAGLVFLAMNAITVPFLFGLAAFGQTTLYTGLPLWQRLGLVVMTAVTAGFCEELIWRGYVITRLEARGRGRWAAITLAAVSFALIHGSPLHWVYTFVIGMVAGYYYTRERTLVPLMISHTILDLWSFGLFVS